MQQYWEEESSKENVGFGKIGPQQDVDSLAGRARQWQQQQQRRHRRCEIIKSDNDNDGHDDQEADMCSTTTTVGGGGGGETSWSITRPKTTAAAADSSSSEEYASRAFWYRWQRECWVALGWDVCWHRVCWVCRYFYTFQRNTFFNLFKIQIKIRHINNRLKFLIEPLIILMFW